MPDRASDASGRARTRSLAAIVALVVLYAGLCKVLLFRGLEYYHADLFSFLEQSWSWYYYGQILHDNVFGHHGAVHHFYLLLGLSPLTIPLGAYGLILGLVFLHLAAALRLATCVRLDLNARLTVLAAFLSPLAYYAFDNPEWGFHPELCYPPLALLFAVELLERRPWRAVLLGALVALVKEDGAILGGTVLASYFVWRLFQDGPVPPAERRAVARTALWSLLAAAAVFAAGVGLLVVDSRGLASTQITAARRVHRSFTLLSSSLAGRTSPEQYELLAEGLAHYALSSLLLLLPLGRRLLRGLTLLTVASPPLVVILVVSAGVYGFGLMVWAPRLATLFALVLACLVFASAAPPGRPTLRSRMGLAALVAFSWAIQLLLLGRLGYSPRPRLDAAALIRGDGYNVSRLTKPEVAFLRCVAARLPGGMPVSVSADFIRPFFHRQSLVFEDVLARAWHPPRLRVVPASLTTGGGAEGTVCRGPGVGEWAVEVECPLLSLVGSCGARGPSPRQRE